MDAQESPPDHPTRLETIAEFMPMVSNQQLREWYDFNEATNPAPTPYPPCIHPSNELEPISIRDMILETHHRGRKALLRICTEACRISGVLVVAEDEHDTVIRLQLFHQPGEAEIPVQQLLIPGMVLLLKEPYLKATSDGSYVLRVDHVSDLVWLSGNDDRIPDAWKDQVGDLDGAKVRVDGNNHFKNKEWGSALQQYTRAIEIAKSPVDAQIAHINRALLNLQLGRPQAAFNDTVAMNSQLPPTEKSMFHEAVCLYKLQKFEACLSKLQEVKRLFPYNREVGLRIERVTARLRECNEGIYDWQDMYRQAKESPPLIDCASFLKNVEIRDSPGKRRGLFTTKPVVAGELLLCEKAFVYSHVDPNDHEQNQATLRLKYQTMRKTLSDTMVKNVSQAIQKVYHEPETSGAFLGLYHGDYKAQQQGLQADSMPVVDSYLVESIIALNSFASGRTSLESLENDFSGMGLLTAQKIPEASGVWCMGTYMNHSCIANCTRPSIGDMMIVRATEDMPAGTELLTAYAKFELTESDEQCQKKLEQWGFSCNCYVCEKKRKTPSLDRQERQVTIQVLRTLFASPAPLNMVQVRRLLDQVDKTYKKSGQKRLKLELQDVYFDLGQTLWRRGNVGETIAAYRRILELGGFVLAARPSSGPQAVIEIRKWGAYDSACACTIINLYEICVATARRPSAQGQFPTMRAYAEIAFSFMVGEKETLDRVFPTAASPH